MITYFAYHLARDTSLLGRFFDSGKISMGLQVVLLDGLLSYLHDDIGLIQIIFLFRHHTDSGDFGLYAFGELDPFLNCNLR